MRNNYLSRYTPLEECYFPKREMKNNLINLMKRDLNDNGIENDQEVQSLVMNYYNYTTRMYFSNEEDELSFTLDYLKEINLIINEKLIKEINRRIEVRKFDADNDKEVYAECCVLQDIRELINKQY